MWFVLNDIENLCHKLAEGGVEDNFKILISHNPFYTTYKHAEKKKRLYIRIHT